MMMRERSTATGTAARFDHAGRRAALQPDGNDASTPATGPSTSSTSKASAGRCWWARVNAAGINPTATMRKEAIESVALQQWSTPGNPISRSIRTHQRVGAPHRMTWTSHTPPRRPPEPIDFMANEVLLVAPSASADHGVIAGWYGNFAEDERALDERRAADPAAPVTEGWMTYTHHPRFGSNYRGLTNRLDLLLECYSYQSFAERVHATKATVTEVLRRIGTLGDAVRDVIESSRTPRADRRAHAIERSDELIDVPTYFRTGRRAGHGHDPAWPRSSARWWSIVHRLSGAGRRRCPPGGARPGDDAGRRRHGRRGAGITVTGCRRGRSQILESAGGATVEGSADTRRIPAGYHRVGAGQPLGAIAAYLCEPESDDGAIENGLVVAPAIGTEFPLWRQP